MNKGNFKEIGVGRRVFIVFAFLPFFWATDLAAVPPDGTYTGTTSEARAISITVSGGVVTQYSIGWSCGATSGTTESNVSCAISGANTFSCGTASCSFTPFTTRFLLGGTFTGGTVAGSYDMSFYPCVTGCSCCFKSGITYSASLPAPALSINDVSLAEGNAGTAVAQFSVTLAPAASQVVTVNWATAPGTANSADYLSGSGGLTFNIGETNKPVAVQVSGDVAPEADETYFVNLSGASGANVADAQGLGTIVDDDRATKTISMGLAGLASMDLLNDPDNVVLTRELGGDALLIGIGWNVQITTVGDSWLSEARMYLDGFDRDGTGLFLTPGAGNDAPGSGTFSSPVIDFTDNGIANIPILADGQLFLQLYDGFDDNVNSADAFYGAGSMVTIQYLQSPNLIFSDGFESGDTSAWVP